MDEQPTTYSIWFVSDRGKPALKMAHIPASASREYAEGIASTWNDDMRQYVELAHYHYEVRENAR